MKGTLYPYISNIKNSRALRSKSKPLLCFLVLFIFIFVFIPTHANAGLFDNAIASGIMEVIGRVFAFILTAIFYALNWIGLLLLQLAVEFLKASIRFIFSVGYTPLSSDFGPVTIAWGIVRDLANMIMIIVLLAIGVGSILNLKIKGGEVNEKLLAPFFLMALLINFTPQITGMLIDLSNILSKFFFDEAFAGTNAFINNNPFEKNVGNVFSAFTTNLADVMANSFESIIAFVFNFTSALILFALSILLIMRVLAIQLLVILSPMAFAMKIFPATKTVFDQWWNQFISWLLLPVTVGFFLWLAILILVQGGFQCDQLKGAGNTETETLDTFGSVIQGIVGGDGFCRLTIMLMSLATIFIGGYIGSKTSAMGAQFIIGQAKALHQKGMNLTKGTIRKSASWSRKPATIPAKALNTRYKLTHKMGTRIGDVGDKWLNTEVGSGWGTGWGRKRNEAGMFENRSGVGNLLRRVGGSVIRGGMSQVRRPIKGTGDYLSDVGIALKQDEVQERDKTGAELNQQREALRLGNFSDETLENFAGNNLDNNRAVAAALSLAERDQERNPYSDTFNQELKGILTDLMTQRDLDPELMIHLINGIIDLDKGVDKLYKSLVEEGLDKKNIGLALQKAVQHAQEQGTGWYTDEQGRTVKVPSGADNLVNALPYLQPQKQRQQWLKNASLQDINKAHFSLVGDLAKGVREEDVEALISNNNFSEDQLWNALLKKKDAKTLVEQELFVKDEEGNLRLPNWKLLDLVAKHLPKQKNGADALFGVLNGNEDTLLAIQQQNPEAWKNLVSIAPQWGTPEQQKQWREQMSVGTLSRLAEPVVDWITTDPEGKKLFHEMLSTPTFGSRMFTDLSKNRNTSAMAGKFRDGIVDLINETPIQDVLNPREASQHLGGDLNQRNIQGIINRPNISTQLRSVFQQREQQVRSEMIEPLINEFVKTIEEQERKLTEELERRERREATTDAEKVLERQQEIRDMLQGLESIPKDTSFDNLSQIYQLLQARADDITKRASSNAQRRRKDRKDISDSIKRDHDREHEKRILDLQQAIQEQWSGIESRFQSNQDRRRRNGDSRRRNNPRGQRNQGRERGQEQGDAPRGPRPTGRR